MKNKNEYLKNVIIITNKTSFDNKIKSLNEDDIKDILSITNKQFYEDYISSIIHYKYQKMNDKTSIIKIYDNIEKNLYHNFIESEYRTYINNLYDLKFNIKLIDENKFIHSDDNKQHSTMSIVTADSSKNIKKELEYLMDKKKFPDKFIDLYYKNNKKYYNYINILPTKIIGNNQ